ncbi:DUF2282 domain-containing protein [Granulosicoccaceae sp. 1_MG-2023]|nr:DUF2282 domain-containing protein [Granulosicoccaceae sp. 1_MG-2023]
MSKKNTVAMAAVGSLMALGMSMASTGAIAAEKDMEKCFGVVKAGKNDCATATSSCAGTSTEDAQKDAFVVMPAGLCDKLPGGSTEAG